MKNVPSSRLVQYIMLSIGDCNFHAEISSLCRADCSNADKPGAIPQHNGLTPFGKVGVHFGDTMIESYQLTKFLTLNKRNKFFLFFFISFWSVK